MNERIKEILDRECRKVVPACFPNPDPRICLGCTRNGDLAKEIAEIKEA